MWCDCVEALKGPSIYFLPVCAAAIFTSAVWEVSAHIWISLEIYMTTSFWNSPCFSGEWWMKAPLRHLRKSLVNHCKKFLLRNLSGKCEQEAEQVQTSSNNLAEQMQTSRAVICGFVSMFLPCTSVSNMNIKASRVKMSWKQSALSKLRSELKASTLFVVLKWTVSLIIHHNNLDRHEQHDTEHQTQHERTTALFKAMDYNVTCSFYFQTQFL